MQPRAGRTAPIWWIAILVILLVVLVGYFLSAIGPAASLIGMVLALVPLAAVLLAVRLVDRWEPEPCGLLAFAVAWGAIAAVGIALGVDLLITMAFGPADSPAREVFAAVVQAPIVEEVAKGIGVFLIFVTARRAFDGPIDGIVYGGLVGAGFAFTENIQYFAISFIEGGAADLTTTFFVRGILSPFAHVMFTSVTGFALGIAARRGLRGGQAVGPWVLGMIGAIALHAFWNGSAVFLDFFALYMTAQVPLFVLFVLGVIALRREEARLTRRRLGDYAVGRMVHAAGGRHARDPCGSEGGADVGEDPARRSHRAHAALHPRRHGPRRDTPARDQRARRSSAPTTSSCCSRERPTPVPHCSRPSRLGLTPPRDVGILKSGQLSAR